MWFVVAGSGCLVLAMVELVLAMVELEWCAGVAPSRRRLLICAIETVPGQLRLWDLGICACSMVGQLFVSAQTRHSCCPAEVLATEDWSSSRQPSSWTATVPVMWGGMSLDRTVLHRLTSDVPAGGCRRLRQGVRSVTIVRRRVSVSLCACQCRSEGEHWRSRQCRVRRPSAGCVSSTSGASGASARAACESSPLV